MLSRPLVTTGDHENPRLLTGFRSPWRSIGISLTAVSRDEGLFTRAGLGTEL